MHAYRLARIREKLAHYNGAMCMLVNPISLRYAIDYGSYSLYQSHIPTTYLFVPRDGPTVLYNGLGGSPGVDELRVGRAISYGDGATELAVDLTSR